MPPQTGKRPNIILFVAEDLDYEGLGCYDAGQTGYTGVIRSGNRRLGDAYEVRAMMTPAIDSLAREGFRSTNYYCTSAICTPARYTMLTGRYAERSPHFNEMYPPQTQANIYFNIGVTRDDANVAKVLQQTGYRTGMMGKWHNYPQPVKLHLDDLNMSFPPDADARHPTMKKAIETWYGKARDYLSEGFGWDVVDRLYPCNPEGFHPRSIAGHNLEWIIEGALGFLEESRGSDQPFFLYLPITVPHSRYKPDVFERANPLATPAGLLDETPIGMPSRKEIVRRVAEAGLEEYALEGLWLDESVNAVLRKLKETGTEEDTCFLFTTDHPTAGKETCHLGRIPLIVRWPGKVQPGVVSDVLLSATDLASTLLDIAGCEAPAEMLRDGRSFKSHLLSQAIEARETVLLEVVNSRAVVSGKWKYIANRLPDELKAGARLEETGWLGTKYYDNVQIRDSVPYDIMNLFPHYLDPDHLYELEQDPLEQINLASDPQHATVLAEMKEKLAIELQRLPHAFGEFT